MTSDIVTLQEAKLFCRVDGDAEDGIFAVLIGAASDAVVDVADGWTPGSPAPDRIKLAVLAHVAQAYDQRQDGVDMPAAAGRLVFPYRKLGI